MKAPKVLILAGSTRKGSTNRLLARQVTAALEAKGLEATFADLREFPMPIYDADLEAESGIPAGAQALKALAREADAFVIVSPEYNGSYPAVLKNALDWISRPEPGDGHLEVFRGKTAAIASASPGAGGGKRVLKQLRELLEMMRMTVIPQQLSVPQSGEAFDGEGRLTRPEDIATLHALAGQLAVPKQEMHA